MTAQYTEHEHLKSQAREWDKLEQWERAQIERTVSIRMWGDREPTALWGKNAKGEWCRYS